MLKLFSSDVPDVKALMIPEILFLPIGFFVNQTFSLLSKVKNVF